MTQFIETLVGIFQSSGFAKFGEPGGWLYAVMIHHRRRRRPHRYLRHLPSGS